MKKFFGKKKNDEVGLKREFVKKAEGKSAAQSMGLNAADELKKKKKGTTVW